MELNELHLGHSAQPERHILLLFSIEFHNTHVYSLIRSTGQSPATLFHLFITFRKLMIIAFLFCFFFLCIT